MLHLFTITVNQFQKQKFLIIWPISYFLLSSSFKGRAKKNFNRSTVFKCSFTDKSSIHNEIQCLINGISLSHFMHVPSSSAGDGPALPLVGVFMNKGNMVLSPRISTNFWLLSDPSWPVMAWFNTFIALFLDIFFSLKLKIKILSFSSNRHLNLGTSIQRKLEERLFFDSTVQFNEYVQF